MSPKKWIKNTYGYARAEVVGALINAVFLFALCFSIAVESFKRFLVIEHIEDPELIMVVGGVGLAINLFGMCLFGDVGHGHSHGDDAGHGHSHSGHGNSHGEKEDMRSERRAIEGGETDSGHQMNIRVSVSSIVM